MAQTPTKPAEYQDLFDLPDHMVGQIIHGMLYAQPRPASAHAGVSSGLGMDLGGPFQRGRGGPGGWWILDEPELHLGQHILVPDMAGWRRERMPNIPDVAYFELVPDWICEILSPSTARIDRTQKMPIYAEYGVKHCWMVDPAAHTLEIFTLVDGQWRLDGAYAEQDRVRGVPFDAIELPLADLWITPSPSSPLST